MRYGESLVGSWWLRHRGLFQHLGHFAGGYRTDASLQQFNTAVDPGKKAECRQVGAAIRKLLEKNLRPRDILTRAAFENAAATIAAAGGSTNGVLHLLALAREAEVNFGLKDLQEIFRRTPVLCSFAPRGTQNYGGPSLSWRHACLAKASFESRPAEPRRDDRYHEDNG